MTGVLLLTGASLLLHELKANRQHTRITPLLCALCGPLHPSALTSFFNAEIAKDRRARRGNISELFVSIVLHCGRFNSLFGKLLAGDAILALYPLAQVDELAPFRTEGTKGIVFPLDRFTAGWALHESERRRALDQYSSFDECDRTFAAHGIQAHRDAFTGGAHNGGDFAVRKRNIDEHAFRFGDAVTNGKIFQ